MCHMYWKGWRVTVQICNSIPYIFKGLARVWKYYKWMDFVHLGKCYKWTDFINLAFSDVKLWFRTNLNKLVGRTDILICPTILNKGLYQSDYIFPTGKRTDEELARHRSSPQHKHLNLLSWSGLLGESKENTLLFCRFPVISFWECFQGYFH